jgi:hypothetical protein
MFPPCSGTPMPRLDEYSVLKFPLTTESAMKKIEDNNTLVFIVDTRANKRQARISCLLQSMVLLRERMLACCVVALQMQMRSAGGRTARVLSGLTGRVLARSNSGA